MVKKTNKTSNKHFKEFIKECNFWVSFFGLNEWDLIFSHKVPKENDSYAHACPDNKARVVFLNLNPDWGVTVPNISRIRRYAFHEISEIRYSKLSGVCLEKLVCFLNMRTKENKRFFANLQSDIDEATHAIIRMDENCIWKPMYLKRFKRKINLED